MPGEGRPGWQKPVLALAILLVVGQAIAFIVLRQRKAEPKADPVVATTPVDAILLEPTPTPTPTPTPPPPTPTTTTPPDAAVVEVTVDAAVAPPTTIATTTTTPPKTTEKKKLSRAELLAQQKKDREEKKREDEERRRAEQQEKERKKLEQERAAAEQAKAAAELERQRLAAQKAEAEVAAARAAAEKAKLEAAKSTSTTVTPAVPAGPDVLVLVLGPGTPSVSSDQIRSVYLGRTSVWPNGTTARPLNRPTGTTAAKKFYGGILKMNAGAFSEHWSELQLGGGGISPPIVSSGKVAVAKVAATSGGFSYVMQSELPENTNGVRLVRLK